MKKCMYLFVFSLLLMVGVNFGGLKVQASTLLSSNLESEDEIEITQDDGTVISFPNQEDYNNYLKAERSAIKNSEEISAQVIMFNRVRTLVSKDRKNMLFVGYSKATPDWMLAPYYDISKGTKHDISGSYKYGGTTINIGFSKTMNVSTRLAADAKRYSKLGGYADITFEKYRVDLYESGQKLSTYYETKKTTHNTYLRVKYK